MRSAWRVPVQDIKSLVLALLRLICCHSAPGPPAWTPTRRRAPEERRLLPPWRTDRRAPTPRPVGTTLPSPAGCSGPRPPPPSTGRTAAAWRGTNRLWKRADRYSTREVCVGAAWTADMYPNTTTDTRWCLSFTSSDEEGSAQLVEFVADERNATHQKETSSQGRSQPQDYQHGPEATKHWGRDTQPRLRLME